MSNKDYKYIVILLLITFAGTLTSGLGFTKSVVIAFVGTFSLVGAFLLANLIFGDKEYGWGHYIIIAVVVSIAAIFLSSS